jgi:hypothetical protein
MNVGWEGIVSERVDSRYGYGKRNGDWVKVKAHPDEFADVFYRSGAMPHWHWSVDACDMARGTMGVHRSRRHWIFARRRGLELRKGHVVPTGLTTLGYRPVGPCCSTRS